MEEVWLKLKLRPFEGIVFAQKWKQFEKGNCEEHPRYAREFLEICPFWEAEAHPPN